MLHSMTHLQYFLSTLFVDMNLTRASTGRADPYLPASHARKTICEELAAQRIATPNRRVLKKKKKTERGPSDGRIMRRLSQSKNTLNEYSYSRPAKYKK